MSTSTDTNAGTKEVTLVDVVNAVDIVTAFMNSVQIPGAAAASFATAAQVLNNLKVTALETLRQLESQSQSSVTATQGGDGSNEDDTTRLNA